MDTKYVLVRLITLLFGESACAKIEKRSDELAKNILDNLKLPEHVTESDIGRSVILTLKELALWMLEQPQNEQFDFDSMNQRFSYNKYDDKIKEVLSDLDRIKKRDDDGGEDVHRHQKGTRE